MSARDMARTVIRAFNAEFGRNANSNPWPHCRASYLRTEPSGLCWHITHLATICLAGCQHGGVRPGERDDQ
jgi:hypothetical protein